MKEIIFYNSLTREKEVFKPINPNEVGMYSCGPTVYNYAHIGNFRAYIFSDLLRRVLEDYGYNVKLIMNLTDVDDKTIKNSINNFNQFCSGNRFLSKFKAGTIGNVIKGLAFIVGSMSAYAIGQSIGSKIADNTTRKYAFVTQPYNEAKTERNNPF